MFKNYAFHVARRRQLVSLLCLIALLSCSSAATAQQARRPLTHNDYDSWRTIQAPQLSRDGKFVAYAFMPQDGDGEIVVRNIATSKEWRAPRGHRPPARLLRHSQAWRISGGPGAAHPPGVHRRQPLRVFSIEPTKGELRKAKREKKNRKRCRKTRLASWT